MEPSSWAYRSSDQPRSSTNQGECAPDRADLGVPNVVRDGRPAGQPAINWRPKVRDDSYFPSLIRRPPRWARDHSGRSLAGAAEPSGSGAPLFAAPSRRRPIQAR